VDEAFVDKVAIAFVGLRFGGYLLEQFLSSEASHLFEVVALCDKDESKTRDYAAKVLGLIGQSVKIYRDLSDVIAQANIEAVVLMTGPQGRAELIRQIIRAGKHVLTTKPFELEPEAALAVLLEAKSLGRVIHLNSPSPNLSEDLRQIRQWCQTYDLGKPIAARAEAWHSGALQESADDTWYDDPELCPIAPIFRIGIYAINDLVQLWGEAEAVQVMQVGHLTRRPTPDTAQLTVQFKNRAIASIFASLCVDDGEANEHRLTLNYERGTIYRNIGYLEEKATRLTLVANVNNKKIVRQKTLRGKEGVYQWDVFYNAVRGAKTNQALLEETSPATMCAGLHIIEAMKLAERSQRTCAVASVPA
jgi:predicted dehydrogenase